MRQGTVKDFISYNNPCFICSNHISIKIGNYRVTHNESKLIYLTPLISPDYTEIDLRITYNSHLTLKITNKTNRFQTNNPSALVKYLEENDLFLVSQCVCYSIIESSPLKFDMNKGFIKPFGISKEIIMVNDDDNNMYFLYSVVDDSQSILEVTKLDKVFPLSPSKLVLPLTLRRKFKSKEHFLNKMKTYLTFS